MGIVRATPATQKKPISFHSFTQFTPAQKTHPVWTRVIMTQALCCVWIIETDNPLPLTSKGKSSTYNRTSVKYLPTFLLRPFWWYQNHTEETNYNCFLKQTPRVPNWQSMRNEGSLRTSDFVPTPTQSTMNEPATNRLPCFQTTLPPVDSGN